MPQSQRTSPLPAFDPGVTSVRVIFDYLGIHHDMSLDESLLLVAAVRLARDALKVQCPTCRCLIFPGSTCGCCSAEREVEVPW